MKLIVDIPDEIYDDIKHGYICSEYADTLIQLIPSSTPYEERPHGYWISANGTYYCSCCKHYAYESQKFDFCQDCGARMQSDLDGFGVSGY